MYEAFYHLTGQPFRLVPDHRFFYASPNHRKGLSYLRYGLQQGEGFIVITGDVGAGKSTLVRQLFAELDRTRITAADIATTNLTATDAVRLIATAFGIQPPATDKASLLAAFEAFLVEEHRAGRRVLLVVDEAQNLPARTLEELRMLSNFCVGGQALFQCFLLGQPQFRRLLSDPAAEQLLQRVAASFHLGPLSADDTRRYIEHRLGAVGWTGVPAITGGAFRRIHEETGGIPRRINSLCGRLLLFGALEELDRLDTGAVDAVAADLRRELEEVAAAAPAGAAGEPAGGTVVPWPALHGRTAGRAGDERLSRLEARMTVHEDALRQVLSSTIGLFAIAAGGGDGGGDPNRDGPMDETSHRVRRGAAD